MYEMTHDIELVNQLVRKYQRMTEYDIQILLNDADQLSVQHYYIGQDKSECLRLKEAAINERKYIVSRAVLAYMKGFVNTPKMTKGKAELSAENTKQVKEAREAEALANYLFEKMKNLLSSIDMIVGRINQRVSELKKERDYQRFTNGEYTPRKVTEIPIDPEWAKLHNLK